MKFSKNSGLKTQSEAEIRIRQGKIHENSAVICKCSNASNPNEKASVGIVESADWSDD